MEITPETHDVLYRVAQMKYGWTHLTTLAQLDAADALVEGGMVEYTTSEGRQAHNPQVKATTIGWAYIKCEWPLSPFALRTYETPPGSWTPREGVRAHPLTEEQRAFLATHHSHEVEDVGASMPTPDDFAARAAGSRSGVDGSNRGVTGLGFGVNGSNSGVNGSDPGVDEPDPDVDDPTAGVDHDEPSPAPAPPTGFRVFVDAVADVLELLLGQARNQLDGLVDWVGAGVHTTVNRRTFRGAIRRSHEAMHVLRGRWQWDVDTRAAWMRIWASAQRDLAGCHELDANGDAAFDEDGRSYSEVRRQGAALADALADALTVPLGRSRPAAPPHIELRAGDFLDLVPKAHDVDLNVMDPNSRLNRAMDELRPVCGRGVDALPLLLGQR